MLLSLTLRNELLSGAEHEKLIGFTFRYLFARRETDNGLQPLFLSSIRRPFTEEDDLPYGQILRKSIHRDNSLKKRNSLAALAENASI